MEKKKKVLKQQKGQGHLTYLLLTPSKMLNSDWDARDTKLRKIPTLSSATIQQLMILKEREISKQMVSITVRTK